MNRKKNIALVLLPLLMCLGIVGVTLSVSVLPSGANSCNGAVPVTLAKIESNTGEETEVMLKSLEVEHFITNVNEERNNVAETEVVLQTEVYSQHHRAGTQGSVDNF